VTLDRLQNEMNRAVKNDPQVKVAIKADRRSPGRGDQVLDVAKAANVSPDRVTAITEKTK